MYKRLELGCNKARTDYTQSQRETGPSAAGEMLCDASTREEESEESGKQEEHRERERRELRGEGSADAPPIRLLWDIATSLSRLPIGLHSSPPSDYK